MVDPAHPAPALIPWNNKKALAGYYCGVFALIPGVGLLLGPIAFYLGMTGRAFAIANPHAKGMAHAWVAMTLGALAMLVNYGVVIAMLVKR